LWKSLWKSLWKRREALVKTNTSVILAQIGRISQVVYFQQIAPMSLLINVLASFDSLRQSTTLTFLGFCDHKLLLVCEPVW
jgi:hypothetical protein